MRRMSDVIRPTDKQTDTKDSRQASEQIGRQKANVSAPFQHLVERDAGNM